MGGRHEPHPAPREMAVPRPTPAPAPRAGAPERGHSLSRGRWTPCLFVWSQRPPRQTTPLYGSAPAPAPPPRPPGPAPPHLARPRPRASRRPITTGEDSHVARRARGPARAVKAGARDLCNASSSPLLAGRRGAAAAPPAVRRTFSPSHPFAMDSQGPSRFYVLFVFHFASYFLLIVSDTYNYLI